MKYLTSSQPALAELQEYAGEAKQLHLKACLYCGCDTLFEEWMYRFDYVKLGSYKEARGPLNSPATSQRFYKLADGAAEDITRIFRQ